jgi:hypothetical protein
MAPQARLAPAPFRARRSQKRHLTSMFVCAGPRAPENGILRPMNPVIAIVLLAAPFAAMAAAIAFLIVFLGRRTK